MGYWKNHEKSMIHGIIHVVDDDDDDDDDESHYANNGIMI